VREPGLHGRSVTRGCDTTPGSRVAPEGVVGATLSAVADRSPIVVGFDLDMTLVDSRPGIAATLDAVAGETGTPIDVELVVGRLGPRLEDEMAHWFPSELVATVANRFRELYADVGVPGTFLLPGASESVAAVRSVGGRVIVVTAKYESNAVRCLDHVGLDVDVVCGWRYGPDKGAALAEHGAAMYVADTPADVVGARGVGVLAVGVATGPSSAADLRDAGADVVFGSLSEFPAWFRAWIAA
jgi:phosphoglycolate phosphatase